MTLRRMMLLTAAILLPASAALAGPDGPSVVGGNATVVNPGTANVTVNQFSDRAIINWRLFDVGANERIQFNQPSSSSIILNRVTGGLGPSQILGTIDANGRVFVINRDGILFGPNAKVNTSGFLATTNDIRNEDFMAGRFNFNIPGRPDASIVNMGTITAQNGGFAALVAPGVRNSGTITATLGTISLAAGNSFNLDFYGDKLITLAIGDQIAGSVRDVATGLPLTSLITNDGKIKANGGRVEITAAAARQVVDAVINTTGVIEANSIGTRNGMIVLGAATAATKPAGAPTQTVKISGTVKANGKKTGTTGGTIIVTGEAIRIANATIAASGPAGGGKVLIGGDWGGGKPDTSLVSNPSAKLETAAVPTATTVTIDAATTINASATDSGNGGKVIVWSDQYTSFAGTILALGGTRLGDGGFAEVSSHGVLNYTGIADLRATNGKFGSLLLDPHDVTISTSPSDGMPATNPFTPTSDSSILNVTVLQNALGLGNVLVTTGGKGSPGAQNGNITVDANVTWSRASTLTLSAYTNISFNPGASITNTGAGSLILRADNSGNGTGYISSLSTGQINWSNSTGTVSIYYNPIGGYTFPLYPVNFPLVVTTNPGVPNQLTAYMLVNSVANLQSIATNGDTLGYNYALGTNIDASGPNFAPIGSISSPFRGIFDGNGGLGVNYTISNLTIAPTSGNTNVGLFGALDTTGVIRNLNVTNASVTADPNTPAPGQFVGILAGTNAGTISNVTVSGTITNGTQQNGVIAGGIVGQNGDVGLSKPGTIVNAHAAVNVTVGSSTTGAQQNSAGGLVGSNPGSIINSDASGTVTGGRNSNIGGLAGANSNTGTITNSFATGNVTLVGSPDQSNAGGLVGFNLGSITASHASGAVMAPDSTASIGGLAGSSNGTITNSFATGNVTGANYVTAGGLVGFAQSGTISGSSAAGVVSVGSGDVLGGFPYAGGLIGFNLAAVSNSSATGNVNGGSSAVIGGLIGNNGNTVTNSFATGNVTLAGATANFNSAGGLVGINNAAISNSYATGVVTGGPNATVGGLVGVNSTGITISNSYATGAVIADAVIATNGGAGGLVGYNLGTITGSHATGTVSAGNNNPTGGLVGINYGTITGSYATGAVSITTNSSSTGTPVGGLVGTNYGTITNSTATGTVTATATSLTNGLVWDNAVAGGFVGVNFGTIMNSTANGNVTDTATSDVSAIGGFVGINHGTITGGHATGNVTSFSTNTDLGLGGFVSENESGTITASTATGAVQATGTGAGFVAFNSAVISNSSASGPVTGGAGTLLGGFVMANVGTITGSSASGNVTGGSTALVAGFVVLNASTIQQSHATGNVTAGDNSFAGGFATINFGTITQSFASGKVTVGDPSFAGGFAAMNVAFPGLGPGVISQSYALGNVTGGAQSFLGGLVGINLGSLNQTYAAGFVSGGPNSITGGLVAVNSLPSLFPAVVPGITGAVPSSGFTPGTATNSYWDTTTTGQGQSAGGTPMTSAQLSSGALPGGYDPGVWNANSGFYPCVAGQCNPAPTPGPAAPLQPGNGDQITFSPEFISPLLIVANELIKETAFNTTTPGEVINTAPIMQPRGPFGGRPFGPPPAFNPANIRLPTGLPPITETRYLVNEVLLQLRTEGTPERIAEIARILGLEILAVENLALTGRVTYRFRITNGRTVRQIIPLLEAYSITAQAQPVYTFQLAQAPATPAPAAAEGDAAQYIVKKLKLPEVHQIATGKEVIVAVVDSAIDFNHPDLAGVIADKFDPANAEEKPHAHGTGMAGAIAAHMRLVGIAPNVKLLAIQAFGVNTGNAQGTSMNIVRGLNWAVQKGAKIINMSFAGPMDPLLQQTIKALHDQGIVLIAAAGNAGPKSPPLYPGADPNVIAVSATDEDDAIYKNANRGRYIAVAAPGVDILVPAPDGGYQLTTGTSVAAAHVSGIAALLIERDRSLNHDAIRRILMETADKLPGARPEDLSGGLVDPLKALQKVGAKSAAR